MFLDCLTFDIHAVTFHLHYGNGSYGFTCIFIILMALFLLKYKVTALSLLMLLTNYICCFRFRVSVAGLVLLFSIFMVKSAKKKVQILSRFYFWPHFYFNNFVIVACSLPPLLGQQTEIAEVIVSNLYIYE